MAFYQISQYLCHNNVSQEGNYSIIRNICGKQYGKDTVYRNFGHGNGISIITIHVDMHCAHLVGLSEIQLTQ